MTVELDKLDLHNRQQLSALMDGELSPDEARFLLRRLQHDRELSAQWERWQLCGDALRGQARAPAPAGFAERVAAGIAAEPRVAAPVADIAPRGRLLRWGSGALAASVALVALFMARQQAPQDEAASAAPAIATTRAAPEPAASADDGTLADAGNATAQTLASAATASIAAASVPRRIDARRASATRTQQAARSTSRIAQAPARAVASAPIAAPAAVASHALPSLEGGASMAVRDPFSRTPAAAPARPWPRSALSPYAGNAAGSLTTGYSNDSAARTFYPFDPSLPAAPSEPQR